MLSAFGTLARRLAPSVVVLDDVDLVAQERSYGPFGESSTLFELMNQMSGLGEDADVAFVLTTNRPDALEPALAARPGRVDLAVEIPLPDAPPGAGCSSSMAAVSTSSSRIAMPSSSGRRA